MITDDEAATWDDTFRRPGATARSWLCERCGEDVDSGDLRLHLLGHERCQRCEHIHEDAVRVGIAVCCPGVTG